MPDTRRRPLPSASRLNYLHLLTFYENDFYLDNIATDQPADWQIVDGDLAELLVGIDDEETAE